jgi:hypothetical protein
MSADKSSEYVITCADLGSEEVLGTSVTVTQSMTSMEHLPPFVDDWIPEKYTNIRVEEFLDEEYDNSDGFSDISHKISNEAGRAFTRGSVRLFDGKRIEEFLVDNDEWSDEEVMPQPTNNITSQEPSISDGLQSQPRLQYRSPTAEVESEVEHAPFVQGVVKNEDDTHDHTSRKGSAEEVSSPPSQPESMPRVQAPPLPVSNNTEEKDSLLSMLRSLENPRMDAQYLEAYGTCVSYVLHVWPKSPNNGKLEHMKALTSMEQSLHLAETLRRLCNTGSSMVASDTVLSSEGTVLEGSNLDQPMLNDELRSLGEVVQEAIDLLQEVPILADGTPGNTLLSSSEASAIKQLNEDDRKHPKEALIRRSTPPFLTWAWLSSGFEQSIPARRVAAENLFTIMQDIDRHLCRSKEDSYANASKTTLAELEHQMVLQKESSVNQTSHAFRPNLPLGFRTSEEPPSPLNYAQESTSTDDAILQSQKDAIIKVVNDIATTAQSFVGLFIPCSYQHPVSQKIWGSLSDLLQVCDFFCIYVGHRQYLPYTIPSYKN